MQSRFAPVRGQRQKQAGQTIVIVALALVGLVGMAALAIDVATLYNARGEIQRAADAAAIAGAKAMVDSGTTTDPSDSGRQTLAQNMANDLITGMLPQNKVGGAAPVLASATFDFDTHAGNPQITVTLERTDLPTFFARVFGRTMATVRATATAEAYNPSGYNVSIAPKCVKPLVIPNVNPNPPGTNPFITSTSGTVDATVIGQRIVLVSGCQVGSACTLVKNPPDPGHYVPMSVSIGFGDPCPSCAGTGVNTYQRGIACCAQTAYTCGGTVPNATVDLATTANAIEDTKSGTQCLINATGPGLGAGQDEIDVSDLVGKTGPPRITAGGGTFSGDLVTTSKSVVTIPIYDGAPIPGSRQVRIIGFLQAFVDDYQNDGDVVVHVLNLVGCSNSMAGTPVGASAIPIRLIHQ